MQNTYEYFLRDTDAIRTLSTSNANSYDAIRGLLYVPELDSIDNACDNDTLSQIPANVTRRTDFPDVDFPFVAVAPWTSPACVQSFLSSMRADNVEAALVFRDDTSEQRPPPVRDPIWTLRDGGRWRDENPFPVFAISGALGTEILQRLAQYSGNGSSASVGEEPTTTDDPAYYVRLYSRIGISSTNGMPSLWVFLIIILAILFAIVLITSIIMHIIQRRQRTLLSRRVARGEVDLEALGIKRLNVPQELLDKMPQYTFTSKSERIAPTPGKMAPPEVPFSQPTCPICLDDFVHNEITVRELPCKHIFHPECIDPFLRDNSSLCPMCKNSALPAGYCPVKVTNLMVRRERLLRRMRQRNGPEPPVSQIPVVGAIQRRIRTLSMPASAADRMHLHNSRMHGHGAHNGDAGLINVIHTDGRTAMPAPSQPMHANGALTDATQTQPQVQDANAVEVPAEVSAQGVSARRAWLRERMARRQQEQYDQQAQEARQVDVGRSLCKFSRAMINRLLY